MLRPKTTAVRLSSGNDRDIASFFDIVFPDYDTWKAPFIVKMQPSFLCLIKKTLSIVHFGLKSCIFKIWNVENKGFNVTFPLVSSESEASLCKIRYVLKIKKK